MTSASSLVECFFAYLPAGEPDPAEIFRLKSVFRGLGYTFLAEPCPMGFLGREEEPPGTVPPFELLHVPPGTAIGLKQLSHLAPDAQPAMKYPGESLRVFNAISCGRDSVEIASDPLGILPYYSLQLPDAMFLCSSLRHLLQAYPEQTRPMDDQGVFEFLCCGTPFAQRTLHKQIQLAPAGQVVYWDRGRGLRTDRSRRLTLQAPDAGIATATAAGKMIGYVRESLERLPSPAVLPITGGFDSRLIAACATALNLKPHMVTLGYYRHDEVRLAQAVAKTLGTQTEVHAPRYPNVLDLMPLWLEASEGLADAQSLFIGNLLSLPLPDGAPIYHGFLGDALSGGRLNLVQLETATSPEEIAQAIVNHFFGGIAPEAAETFRLSASLPQATEDVLGNLVSGFLPHQTFLLWHLETLQRRFVGQQLLYLGRRFMPLPVYYYSPLMAFALTLPRMALDFRTLMKQIFQLHFPELATLPHADYAPNVIPSTLAGLRYVSGWGLRRLGGAVLRRARLRAPDGQPGSYIWALWHDTTAAQRKLELERLHETCKLFESRLGWRIPHPEDAVWSKCSATERKQMLLLRRMYLLGEYVNGLPEATSTASSLAYFGASA